MAQLEADMAAEWCFDAWITCTLQYGWKSALLVAKCSSQHTSLMLIVLIPKLIPTLLLAKKDADMPWACIGAILGQNSVSNGLSWIMNTLCHYMTTLGMHSDFKAKTALIFLDLAPFDTMCCQQFHMLWRVPLASAASKEHKCTIVWGF